ncbi:hypothetical protein FPV67DRAFT_837482 [Lyophyllum atratum]|nr:hypothetical protein FPV67DRAFT_837482 [Lyophyllum atratum]
MISPEEHEFLKSRGIALLSRLALIASSLLPYGTSILLFFLSTYTLFRRPAKSLTIWTMFGATLISFLFATMYWAAAVASVAGDVHDAFLGSTPWSSDEWQAYRRRTFVVYQISAWAAQGLVCPFHRRTDLIRHDLDFYFQIITNDMIVVWRAWVLCFRYRRLMGGIFILLLGTCGLSFTILGLTSSVKGLDMYLAGGTTVIALFETAAALSLATNTLSTMLIAYTLWSNRKMWRGGVGMRWSQVQRILLMIVESGALYLVSQMTAMTVLRKLNSSKEGTRDAYFANIIWAAYIQITAMYPTIVFLLIRYKQSFTDMDCFAVTHTDVRQSSV